MKRLISFYHPKLPVYLVYMLQQVEYDPHKLLRWIIRIPNLTRIMYRQRLVVTDKARMLIIFGYGLWMFFLILSFLVGIISLLTGLVLLLMVPFLTIICLYAAILLAWQLIEEPRRKKQINTAKKIFTKHKGTKIAIAGSYGKTSMKELLEAVLRSEKKIAATPGNQNVLISHARWANTLSGGEDILLIEYGEGEPGDIDRFARVSHPDLAIITGLAPNHLDRYKTLHNVVNDLFSIEKFVSSKQLFINMEDAGLNQKAPSGINGYSRDHVLGWRIKNIEISLEGTSFSMVKGTKKLTIHSRLLGRHQVGPIALAAALADKFGISSEAIKQSIAEVKPYEHRMQPRHVNGAWVIDDTYNGNIEGIKAGLELLSELPAKRKLYITPGLVDQGRETQRIHREIGAAIAKASPTKVILMQNSATKYIQDGLIAASYAGSVEIIEKPLEFYTNLEHLLAAGDLVLMQNDWTDNYL